MAGHRSTKKSSRQKRTSTEWRGWVYNYDEGRYENSRINSHGEVVYEYGGKCDPPEAATTGLEGPVEGISLSRDETEQEEAGVATQEADVLPPSSSSNETPAMQPPSSPYAVMMFPPQQQSRGFSSGQGMTQYGNTVPNGPVLAGFTPNYGRGLVQAKTWDGSSFSRGGSTNESTMPQSTYNPKGNASQRNQTGNGSSKRTKYSTINAEDIVDTGLHKEFKFAKSKDFKERRVFKVLWIEPKGNDGKNSSNYSQITEGKYGEKGYASIRRFVVWKNYEGHALCLPILTYGKRGTTKPGVKSAHHAIIFTESRSANPPRSLSSPPRGAEYEPQLPNSPVCVELMDPRNQLDVMSRLNYAKVYTVEHNIKVCFLGRIHKDSRAEFEASYHRVQSADNYPTGQMVDNDIYGGIDEEEGILPENEIFEY